MEAGRYQEAISLYRKLVEAIPGNPGMVLNLGLALHSAGSYGEAIKWFKKAADLAPDQAIAWLLLGSDLLQLGRPAEGIKPLERAVEIEPRNATARLLLASAAYDLRRFTQAGEQSRRVAEQEPKNPRAWHLLAMSELALFRDASRRLEEAAPESAYWYALFARSQAEAGRYGRACYYYKLALERRPDLRTCWTALETIYRKSGHPDWAAAAAARRSALGPLDCRAHPLECEFAAGHFSKVIATASERRRPEAYYWLARTRSTLALRALSRLARLPQSVELYLVRAEIYGIRKMYAMAVAEMEKAKTLAPGDTRVQETLAEYLWLSRNYKAAAALLKGLVQKVPLSATLNYELGDSLLKLYDARQAIQYLRASVKVDPGSVAAHAALGRAYMSVGKPELAIPHLKVSLGSDQDGSVHYQLARAYRALGEPAKARQVLADYRKIQETLRAQDKSNLDTFQVTPP